MIAQLRQWLIEIVREAIRAEFPVIREAVEEATVIPGKVAVRVPLTVYQDVDRYQRETIQSPTKSASKPIADPISFEAMQELAIQQCEVNQDGHSAAV